MNFVFWTDPHIMGVNPRARKDNFPDTIINKIEEINEIATEVKAVAQLCGGDLYDRADVANSVARRANQTLVKSPTDIWSVVGNHDEYGYNPESVERAMIGVIESTGIIKRLNMSGIVFKDNNGLVVTVTGCDSYYELDKGGRIEDYCPQRQPFTDIHIHVVHGYLSLYKRLEEIPHTLIDDIVEHTEADIILTGHEHTGFGVIKKRNKQGRLIIFCNPGALGRISASMSEMDRMPRVAIVEINSKTDYDVKERVLKCARPSEEVLDRTILEEEIEKEKKTKQFAQTLENFTVENLDINHVVDKIAKKDGVPPVVVDEARKQLQKAEEELAQERNQELGE